MKDQLIEIFENCKSDFFYRNPQIIDEGQFCAEIESFAEYYCACNHFSFTYSSIILQILIFLLLAQNDFDGQSAEEIINHEEQNLDLTLSSQVCEYLEFQSEFGINRIDDELFDLKRGRGLFSNRNAISDFELHVIKDCLLRAKNDKDILKLAEIIGRHGGITQKKQNLARNFRPAVAYDGITFSDNIRTIVPSELALHKNQSTNLFFLEKLADKQLQTYKLGNDKSYSNDGSKKKGPIIVCIDSSGSMAGGEEQIAKAMVIAITMIAQKEKRNAFIINFSDDYESIEIGSKDSFKKLQSFLSRSFHGGTDIINALRFAVENQKNGFKNADILLVSDFMDVISAEDKQFILENKTKGTCFYGLVTGKERFCNKGLVNLMDVVYYKEGL